MNNKQLITVTSANVSKSYQIYDEAVSWKVIFKKKKSKTYQALKDITFTVPKGKFLGVLGRNGAGKSTLLRTLGGIYQPDSGLIKISGNLSGLFELGGVSNPYLTGRQYSYRILMVLGAKKQYIDDLVNDVDEFSELGEFFDKAVHTYSSGMAARLYFSTATAMQHDVYLIDEVLSVGDAYFQAKCWRRLRDRFSQGASGILVTHDWSAVIKICELACILENGKISHYGPADKIVTEYLGIKRPERKIAWFADDNPDNYSCHELEDTTLEFDIELTKPVATAFGYSIEYLQLGIGWEIVLLETDLFVADKPGRYRCKLAIPKLPLGPGKYYLNLFLSGTKDSEYAAQSFDCKSWTLGNPHDLFIKGNSLEYQIHQPLQWHKKA